MGDGSSYYYVSVTSVTFIYASHNSQRIKTTYASRDPIRIRLVCNRAGMKENKHLEEHCPLKCNMISIPFHSALPMSSPCLQQYASPDNGHCIMKHNGAAHAQPPPAAPEEEKNRSIHSSVLTPANSLTRSRVGKSAHTII